MYRVDRRHRPVAAENVRYAFPNLDEPGVDRLARASYMHLTTVLVEMMRIPRVFHPGNIHRRWKSQPTTRKYRQAA
jgi:KDO2-lipid IV(A) lauroyltransferase